MFDFPTYKLLETTTIIDTQKLAELVSLMNEVKTLESRIEYLKNVMNQAENIELAENLHFTKAGEILIIQEMEDDHLENLIQSLIKYNKRIKDALKQEYYKRFKKFPKENLIMAIPYNMIHGLDSKYDDDDIDGFDLHQPF